jgi:uncharacterized protein
MKYPLDRDILDQFLLSDAVPQDSMGLYELEGFLTGLAAGPKTVPYGEWSCSLWGTGTPYYSSRTQEEQIHHLLIKRYQQITEALADSTITTTTFYHEAVDDSILMAAAWADGFLQAMELRPEAWLPLIQYGPASLYLMPLLILYRDMVDQCELLLEQELRQTIVSAAASQIPACVLGIRVSVLIKPFLASSDGFLGAGRWRGLRAFA